MQHQSVHFNNDSNIAKQWTNHQAYHFAFSELFMRRCPDNQATVIGNNQRALFLPVLHERLAAMQPSSDILDVGAGSGDMIELALNRLTDATIHINEPNPILLNLYQEKIGRSPSLQSGTVFNQVIEHYFDTIPQAIPQAIPQNAYDGILAIHMIYHLTDCTEANIQPEQDLINFIQFLFDRLRPGGSLFLVYADQTRSFIGKATSHFYQTNEPDIASRLQQTFSARNHLLKDGHIQDHLTVKPNHQANIKIHQQDAHAFAHTLEELAMMSMMGELNKINDKAFEFDKFANSLAFLQQHGDQVGLQKCVDGNKADMWQINQPQVVFELSKDLISQ